MQLVSYVLENAASYGVRIDRRIYALPPRLGPAFPDLRSVLEGGRSRAARSNGRAA